MITKKHKRKIASTNTGKSKVLFYIDTSLITIFKDTCKKNRISGSEQLSHLLIKFIGEDCLK